MSGERAGVGPRLEDIVVHPAARLVPHEISKETVERQGTLWQRERDLDRHITEALDPLQPSRSPKPQRHGSRSPRVRTR